MNLPKSLSLTLAQFNAASLADGDLAAGTNILASMCCTLCGILPHGAGFKAPDCDILPVGLDFLMLDGLSQSLTDAKVFRQMTDMQAALTANVAEGNTYEAHHGFGKTASGRTIQAAPSGDIAMNSLRYSLDGFSVRPGDSSPFSVLLSPSAAASKSDFKKNPSVFVRLDAGSPLFEKHPPAHLSQPFIRAFLDKGSGTARFLQQLRSIVQCGVGGTALHPRIALSAPPSAFRDLFSNGAADFLNKSLWIFDHPQSAIKQCTTAKGSFPIRQVFDEALCKAWSQRLDFRRTAPPVITYDWKEDQGEWIAYLGRQESRFPGISATAYTLFASLLFGLCRLWTKQSRSPDPEGAFEMAKHLVERMISLREHLVQSEEQARLWKVAIKLLPKFGGHAYSARELVRKSNRLPIDDSRRALQLLAQEGIVVQVGPDHWQLVLPVKEGLQRIKTSMIDI